MREEINVKRPNFALTSIAATVMLVGTCSPALAATVYKDGDTQIDITGRMQTFGVGQYIDGHEEGGRDNARIYLFNRQNRLGVTARKGDYKMNVSLGLSGEETWSPNNAGTTPVGVSFYTTLQDLNAEIPLGFATFRVGQFQVPFGREELSEGGLLFADRSIMHGFMRLGRDAGMALEAHPGPLHLTAGLFTGGGRNTPQRHIPQILGIPLVAVRAGIGDQGGENPYYLNQALGASEPTFGAFINGFYTKDSYVGHSSVLNVKSVSEKSFILQPNYNPYIGGRLQGEYFGYGVDGLVKLPLGDTTLMASAELDYTGWKNQAGAVGEIDALGGQLTGAWIMKPGALGLRYTVVAPDPRMTVKDPVSGVDKFVMGGKNNTSAEAAELIHEITPSLTFFVNDNLKLVFDAPITLNDPIAVEKGIGAYRALEHDETGILKGTPASATLKPDGTPAITPAKPAIGYMERQLTYQARATLQYSF